MKTFGEMIRLGRSNKAWTGKDLKDRVKEDGGKMSMAYVIQIEVHGEIPSPEMIVRLCRLLDLPILEMMELAKQGKREKFEHALNLKYKV
jgi:ribosome-binding protein aMBF1 (putative translation factor)